MIHRLIIEVEKDDDIAQIKEMAERLGASITITLKQATGSSEAKTPSESVSEKE